MITNCRVLQCENGNYFIAEKEICVDEGYVCDNVVNPEIVDLQHRILMPTYFNIHKTVITSFFCHGSPGGRVFTLFIKFRILFLNDVCPVTFCANS